MVALGGGESRSASIFPPFWAGWRKNITLSEYFQPSPAHPSDGTVCKRAKSIFFGLSAYLTENTEYPNHVGVVEYEACVLLCKTV